MMSSRNSTVTDRVPSALQTGSKTLPANRRVAKQDRSAKRVYRSADRMAGDIASGLRMTPPRAGLSSL